MGTRADFYVGRGENAEWLGSIAYGADEGLNPRPWWARSAPGPELLPDVDTGRARTGEMMG